MCKKAKQKARRKWVMALSGNLKYKCEIGNKSKRESSAETKFRKTLSYLCCEVFAAAKVKLLRSKAWILAQVKSSLPSLRRGRNFTYEVNFTIEDHFTCPQGQT